MCGGFGLKLWKNTLCKASKAEDGCLGPAMFMAIGKCLGFGKIEGLELFKAVENNVYKA